MSEVGGPAEAAARPRYLVDVGTIRVVVDNEADATVARRVAKELAALRERPAS